MKKYILAIFLIAIIGITCFIFSNSLKTTEETYKDSDSVVDIVKPIVGETDKKDSYTIDFLVRKGAHIIEFFALGFSVAAFMFFISEAYKKCLYGWGMFYVLTVGVVDEYIQSFNGRTSSVEDVVIDFSGAACGILLAIIVYLVYKLIKFKKIKNLEE